MDTRIKRFKKLRDRVEKETNILKTKNEQQKKLGVYEKALNKINPKIFKQVTENSLKDFPNLESLVTIEREIEEEKTKKIMEKASEIIENLKKKPENITNQKKRIGHFIPSLNNESIIKSQTENLNLEFKNLKSRFQFLIEKRENILKKVGQKKEDLIISEENLFKKSKENEVKIEKKIEDLKFFINKRKKRLRLVIAILATLIIFIIGCLSAIIFWIIRGTT